ncbi:MAG: bifunctional tetrahydrofolate synthase/dihydrofolate synthase [Gammaproteobacteria bacterium]|nr:MAG: bifunctional tetrahydrofolate synthase/dihydrofolate synthase [Gammaproteobacteria bacterium]
MRFNHLTDWLNWQESLNPKAIDLGLDRVAKVLVQAGLSSSFACPLITVAGTNGKGSVVAMLEAMAMAAGLNVCSYTSPHLFQYNERIKINGQPVADNVLCDAFDRIDQARKTCQLTYFEFATLAAIDIFFKQQPDLVILEVGLGGRLDAVNIMDSDVSVLTSVAIDHIDWLGDDRELIGYEKAGVFRSGKPVVCGERDVPDSVIQHAEKLNCEFMLTGRDYVPSINNVTGRWNLRSCYKNLLELTPPGLIGEFQYHNAATAIIALQALQIKLSEQIVSTGLQQINLPGRFQRIHEKPSVYVDVAHNPQAAKALASQLKKSVQTNTKTWAIIAMLSDKDVLAVVTQLCVEIDDWCFAGLTSNARGLDAQTLFNKTADAFNEKTNEKNLCKMQNNRRLLSKTVAQACDTVLSKAKSDDRIIIFGSFYTVAEAMNYFSQINLTR